MDCRRLRVSVQVRVAWTVACVVGISASAFAGGAAGKPAVERGTLAVADFQVTGELEMPVPERTAPAQLRAELVGMGLEALDRDALLNALSKSEMTMSDLVERPCMLQDHKFSGARYVVFGVLVKGDDLAVSLRVSDAASGAVVMTACSATDKEELLDAALRETARAVAAAMGVEDSGRASQALRPKAVTPALIRFWPARIKAFAMQLAYPDSKHPYEKLIDEVADTGANTIMLVVYGWQDDASTRLITVDATRTVTKQRLGELVAHAHKKNLAVILMPMVLLANPKDGEWRGRIQPAENDPWWDDYRGYITDYANLSRKCGVDALMVGTELVGTESIEGQWRKLIRDVRKVYSGPLSYEANWDHYKSVEWWNELDLAAMNAFHDLTEGSPPTLDTMLDHWSPFKQAVLEWRKGVNRPLLFSEVGYPNQITCAQFPWDYTRATDSPDPATQARCYESFFKAWWEEQSLTGAVIWEWRNTPDLAGGPDDTSYIPTGKQALDVIRREFGATEAASP